MHNRKRKQRTETTDFHDVTTYLALRHEIQCRQVMILGEGEPSRTSSHFAATDKVRSTRVSGARKHSILARTLCKQCHTIESRVSLLR